jgi:hypothetical protein
LKLEESAIFFFEALRSFLCDAFLASDLGDWKNGTAQQDRNDDIDRFKEHIMGVEQPGADGHSRNGEDK